ncbi:hypothetical protein ACJ73_09797 [Blastomyces percursus]|uniref:Uncharacterized protein n=1 Tax=Blastomyces percursus TaxID=1658174 RepID=A0A1J9Q3C3_9EURO|nr:hypothetical protein ACJ73_09797 [Blastomyces percursus]
MAFADGAIRDYAPLNELLNDVESGLPDDLVKYPIHIRSEVANLPLFWPYTQQLATNSTGQARGADAFEKQFAEVGHRAGFESNLTVRACRRWVEADDLYSETARMKFAGQVTRTMFGTMLTPVCQVDGQATYLGIGPREDHIKYGRTLQLQRHAQLLQTLPARLEMEFQKRGIYITDLKKRSKALSLQMKIASEDEKPRIQNECKNIYNEIRRLYNVELKSQRQQQPLRLQRVKEDRPLFNAHERTFF